MKINKEPLALNSNEQFSVLIFLPSLPQLIFMTIPSQKCLIFIPGSYFSIELCKNADVTLYFIFEPHFLSLSSLPRVVCMHTHSFNLYTYDFQSSSAQSLLLKIRFTSINVFWILIFTIKCEITVSIKSEEGYSVNFEEKIQRDISKRKKIQLKTHNRTPI